MAKRKRDSDVATSTVKVSFLHKEEGEVGPVIGMLQLFIVMKSAQPSTLSLEYSWTLVRARYYSAQNDVWPK
jgi:hypothetical protein